MLLFFFSSYSYTLRLHSSSATAFPTNDEGTKNFSLESIHWHWREEIDDDGSTTENRKRSVHHQNLTLIFTA